MHDSARKVELRVNELNLEQKQIKKLSFAHIKNLFF